MTNFRDGYATHADFCDVLESDLNSLYLLAFLLTANHQEAERCFVSTVNEGLSERVVFKEWVGSWVRRNLIRAAISIIRPDSTAADEKRESASNDLLRSYSGIELVARLNPLERFVFVMSVLERYSVKECSLLLGCSPKSVEQARVRAFQELPDLNVRPSDVEFGLPSLVGIPA